ncbi:MarR family winged helix-turn-helix transcriptional regulator [Rhizocola hellebori]|nr:MarR family transcriptional regulator [Rhizocola hellebori]
MRRSARKQADPDLGILSSRLLFAVQKALYEGMAQERGKSIGPRHGAVLAHLDEDGSRATDLARLSGQHKQVIGTLIDELEAAGYVRREPDPQDRRAKLIVPTALGLEKMRRSDEIVEALEQEYAKVLGARNFATFKRLFRTITEAAEPAE